MAKTAKKKGPDQRVVRIAAWFNEQWPDGEGCMMAYRARNVLRTAIQKRWSLSVTWRRADLDVREYFWQLFHEGADDADTMGDVLRDMFDDYPKTHAIVSKTFEKARAAEIKRLEALAAGFGYEPVSFTPTAKAKDRGAYTRDRYNIRWKKVR